MKVCPICRELLQENVTEEENVVRLSCPTHGLMDCYCPAPAQNVLASEYYHLKVQA
jgi:hypothetical protein